MRSSSPPKPPDPAKTAAAQTAQNIGTAVAQGALNNVNQITPDGSLTYMIQGPNGLVSPAQYSQGQQSTQQAQQQYERELAEWEASQQPQETEFRAGSQGADSPSFGPQSGQQGAMPQPPAPPQGGSGGGSGFKWTDPNSGQVYDIPQYTAVQTLSEQQQAIKDRSDQAEQNMAGIARDQSARLGELLGTPVDLSNEATEARLMELGRKRLDPAMDRRRESLRTTLAQQGIREGSEAFDRAMMRFGESENDAYNQLLLQGRGQAVQEALTARNQPINETTALLSGSQVSQPNFVPTQSPQLANVDRAGLEMSAYNAERQNWQQKQQQKQAMMGGLFGLAAGGLSGGYF